MNTVGGLIGDPSGVLEFANLEKCNYVACGSAVRMSRKETLLHENKASTNLKRYFS